MAPKEPAKLIRLDAFGRVETLQHMHTGTSTNLRLPSDVSEIDAFTARLLNRYFEPVGIAA
jgi:hypothetical protein